MSNKNINNIFENYTNELKLDYNIDGTFIKKIYTMLCNTHITPDTVTTTSETPELSSRYMAKEISEYIKTNKFHHYITRYDIDGMTVNVSLYSVKQVNANQYLFFIKLILTLFSRSATLKHKEIHIKLLLAPMKKKYPCLPVEPHYINSGQSDPRRNEVLIFRTEEWFKVLIHECVHLFCLDFSRLDIDYTRMFKTLFHIDSEFLFFESLTEFLARTINLSVVAYYTKDNITYDEFEQVVKINVSIERIYCIAQMNHLLHKMGYTYEDLIYFRKPIFKEKTNFFCYYVLTTVLFYYYDDTMRWLLTNQSFLQFSNDKVYPFFNYIKQKYKSPELLQCIQRINRPLHNCNMSVFEILL